MVGSVGGVLLLLFWFMAERTCLVVCWVMSQTMGGMLCKTWCHLKRKVWEGTNVWGSGEWG